jgi:hypothetical protein
MTCERRGMQYSTSSAAVAGAQFCAPRSTFQDDPARICETAIRGLNEDFGQGAIAVKIWKNIGMEIKDARGSYPAH